VLFAIRFCSVDGGTTWSSPALLSASATGHQSFPFLAASNGRVSAIWYDSQGDPDYAPTRPPFNSTGQTSACLNVRYAESTDGGMTWGSSIAVNNTPTNLNYEQVGGRRVPFFGDYITVAAQGNSIGNGVDRSAEHDWGLPMRLAIMTERMSVVIRRQVALARVRSTRASI
jgi:hypothetical protein